MSLSSAFDTVNPQLECQLLQAPYDIRREILNYLVPSSVHIFQNCGRLELSECFGCPQIPRYGVGEERQQGLLDDDPNRQERLARRLVSSWGTHWRCEEMMLRTRDIRNHGTDEVRDIMGALMRTCKKLQQDVSDHLRQDITLIVTDIATLDALLHDHTRFMAHAFHNARKLAITFNLPIDVLTAIEMQSTGWSVHALPQDRSNKWTMNQAALWLRAGPALGRLKKLTKCDFWLDHNNSEYWWEFNEAAILAPLLSLANRNDVELVVDLPSHAADDVPTPPFKIHRRLRQELFGVENSAGRLSVIRKAQFPVMKEIAEFINEVDNNEEEREKNSKMFDAQEREMWRQGEDVDVHLRMSLAEVDTLCTIHNI